jgi:hypothetical protein
LGKEIKHVTDKVARPMNLVVTTQKAAIIQKENPRPPSAQKKRPNVAQMKDSSEEYSDDNYEE